VLSSSSSIRVSRSRPTLFLQTTFYSIALNKWDSLDFFDFELGIVICVDSGVVDRFESDGDWVFVTSGLCDSGDLSDLVVPVGFNSLDPDVASSLDLVELGGGDGHVSRLSRSEGADRNGKEKEGDDELVHGEV